MVKVPSFQSCSVLLLGDFLLDTYTIGDVRRISPEAPVPIVAIKEQKSAPGGAGNAALNLKALGSSVFVLGRIGADPEGGMLKTKLKESQIDTTALFIEEGYQTPVKNRIIAGNQQLLRLDLETIIPIQEKLETFILDQLPSLIAQVQIVVISDYGKGFLSNKILSKAISLANEQGICSIIDPKGIDFRKYKGATLIKPNLSEAIAASKMSFQTPLDTIAKALFHESESGYLLITKSEEGMSLFHRDGVRSDFSVFSKEVKDVTGAGDTVLAVMSVAMANQADLPTAVQMANIAAGIAIERIGCAQVTFPEILEKMTTCGQKAL